MRLATCSFVLAFFILGHSYTLHAEPSDPPILLNLAEAARESYVGKARVIAQSQPLSVNTGWIIFSNNGKRVILYYMTKLVLLNAETGKILGEISYPDKVEGAPNHIHKAEFSPNSKYVLVTTSYEPDPKRGFVDAAGTHFPKQGHIDILSSENLARVRSIPNIPDQNGDYIYYAVTDNDESIIYLEHDPALTIRDYWPTKSRVKSCRKCIDVFSITKEGIKSGKKVWSNRVKESDVYVPSYTIAVSSDQKQAAIAADTRLITYDLSSGAELHRFDLEVDDPEHHRNDNMVYDQSGDYLYLEGYTGSGEDKWFVIEYSMLKRKFRIIKTVHQLYALIRAGDKILGVGQLKNVLITPGSSIKEIKKEYAKIISYPSRFVAASEQGGCERVTIRDSMTNELIQRIDLPVKGDWCDFELSPDGSRYATLHNSILTIYSSPFTTERPVSGKIIDQKSGSPIPDSEVEISFLGDYEGSRSILLKTDSEGRFAFVLPDVDIELTFRASGYSFETLLFKESASWKQSTIPLIPLKKGEKFVAKNILFDTGKATLRPESRKEILRAVKVFKENKDISIEIKGHTDSVGDAAANTALSLERANTVLDFMIKEGIKAERLNVTGVGSKEPVASNSSEEGRALNRRIEFILK